jgi:hypothetical protein
VVLQKPKDPGERQGIGQAARGELHYLGAFAKYADDEID